MHDDGGLDGAGRDRAGELGDPALRVAMSALVDTMAEAAGSNRRLEEQSGVSEATVRNFRRGRFPRSSTAKTEQLDVWAAGRLPDHPAPGAAGSLTDLLARWQGTPPDEPDPEDQAEVEDQAPEDARRAGARRRTALKAVNAVALVAGLVAVGLLIVRVLDDGSEPSGVAGVRIDRDLPLDADNFCGWELGTDPIPLVSADPLVMRVDARCNAPAEPDPVLDVGTAIFDRPDNEAGTKVGVIRSGNTFLPECYVVSADVVGDASPDPNSSGIWVRAVEPAGFLPVINLGGGYTEEQLDALALPQCPAAS